MAEAYVTDFESNMYFKIVLEDLLESLNKVLEFEYSNIICCFIVAFLPLTFLLNCTSLLTTFMQRADRYRQHSLKIIDKHTYRKHLIITP